jgi:hypothetical protein
VFRYWFCLPTVVSLSRVIANLDVAAFVTPYAEFEGTATKFYKRVRAAVVVCPGEDGEETVDAWTYVRHDDGGGPPFAQEWPAERLANEPFISCYTVDHARAFRARERR